MIIYWWSLNKQLLSGIANLAYWFYNQMVVLKVGFKPTKIGRRPPLGQWFWMEPFKRDPLPMRLIPYLTKDAAFIGELSTSRIVLFGISSSQLTFIFFRGVGIPPTRFKLVNYKSSSFSDISRAISTRLPHSPRFWCWLELQLSPLDISIIEAGGLVGIRKHGSRNERFLNLIVPWYHIGIYVCILFFFSQKDVEWIGTVNSCCFFVWRNSKFSQFFWGGRDIWGLNPSTKDLGIPGIPSSECNDLLPC